MRVRVRVRVRVRRTAFLPDLDVGDEVKNFRRETE